MKGGALCRAGWRETRSVVTSLPKRSGMKFSHRPVRDAAPSRRTDEGVTHDRSTTRPGRRRGRLGRPRPRRLRRRLRRLRRRGGRRGQDPHLLADGGHQRQRRHLHRRAQDRVHRGHRSDPRRAGPALGRRARQVRHRHGRRHRPGRRRGRHHLGARVRRRGRARRPHRGHRGRGPDRGTGRGARRGGHARRRDVRHALVRGRALDPRQPRDARGGGGQLAAPELGRAADHDHPRSRSTTRTGSPSPSPGRASSPRPPSSGERAARSPRSRAAPGPRPSTPPRPSRA